MKNPAPPAGWTPCREAQNLSRFTAQHCRMLLSASTACSARDKIFLLSPVRFPHLRSRRSPRKEQKTAPSPERYSCDVANVPAPPVRWNFTTPAGGAVRAECTFLSHSARGHTAFLWALREMQPCLCCFLAPLHRSSARPVQGLAKPAMNEFNSWYHYCPINICRNHLIYKEYKALRAKQRFFDLKLPETCDSHSSKRPGVAQDVCRQVCLRSDYGVSAHV
jgi:hypothetical protein